LIALQILISEEAKADMKELPFGAQILAAAHINKLKERKYGQQLEDKHGYDLTECYRIYFGDRSQYRIIWWITEDGNCEILEVLVIGEREGFKAYEDAHIRVQSRKQNRKSNELTRSD